MTIRPVRASAALLAVLALAACATGGGAPAPAADLAATFAPALNVDLAAMRPTRGGARVRDLRTGDGALASHGATVQVRYAGWLADGTPIDSVGAREAPVAFRVGSGQAVRGWDEGVLGMRVGGRRQVVIPPSLGYGAKGQGRVPPNAVLVFVIDLVAVR